MKILSWNLNHRIGKKNIPNIFYDVMMHNNPDIIILNEYVDPGDGFRDKFISHMATLGFGYYLTSPPIKRIRGYENNVAVISKLQISKGSINEVGSAYEAVGANDEVLSRYQAHKSNILHVIVDMFKLNILGIRVPAMNSRDIGSSNVSKAFSYHWDSLLGKIQNFKFEKFVVIGDFNCDPFNAAHPRKESYNAINSFVKKSNGNWKIFKPKGDGSFIGKKSKTSIDHSLLSSKVKYVSSKYIDVSCNVVLAGSEKEYISDHRPLELIIEDR